MILERQRSGRSRIAVITDQLASGLSRNRERQRQGETAGLEHRAEAMEYALGFGRGLDTELADRFVGMYVNEYTCDYGAEGRQAVAELLRRGEELGAFPERVELDFVS